ncbi:hypothetical protein [Paenibacillus radicis (ex Gao et al. 2016)]|uniref:Uncharacterized protein n=1 Tax=Paenibacillus radicis (ex Gao et al. 2016) TaxID=1737354 RepID=A0A917HS91_9BACL|nr:hypothetical protein [Paenibacillus radicis (ex Gao et al. 2016)]GGG88726.1 hypothetical protein GCM10010918_54190 [Paenibacillus radicis (ex Gao et al. 2016)]
MTNISVKKAAIILSASIVLATFSGQAWANQGTTAAAPAAITKADIKNPYYVAGIDDPAEFTTYYAKLQKAVKDNKPEEVAKLISYPMNLNKDNKTYAISNKDEFIKKYDRIFTSRVREQLLAQKADKVFVNWKGIMVGEGDLWIGKQDNKLGVIAVNVINNPYEAAGIKNAIEFEHFLNKLQKDVSKGNKSEVAISIAFPLTVNHNGLEIKSKKEFMAKYDKIMTAKIKKKLLAQKADKVVVNWKGVMVGNGEIWIGQIGEQIKVFALNQ